jgi:glycosyltransferase involved in cell wall biosynthesis
MRVIGSKVDGSREALLDGQLGRLVAPNVPEQLAKAISEVLCGGSSRERNSLVKCFDLRISGQGRRMVDGTDNKNESLGVTAQRPRSGET